jgi:hypothetical protein
MGTTKLFQNKFTAMYVENVQDINLFVTSFIKCFQILQIRHNRASRLYLIVFTIGTLYQV